MANHFPLRVTRRISWPWPAAAFHPANSRSCHEKSKFMRFAGGPVLLAAALALPPRSRVVLVQNAAEGKVAAIYESGSPRYLNTQRPELLGEVPSHELLEADNRNGVLSPTLARDTSLQQFVFVDEPSCIGCRARPRRSS